MPRLWSLGGLSLSELIRRTALESWQDSVFGQGGRMAFYQFLAIFPSIAIFLAMGARLPHLSDYPRNVLQDFSRQLLPEQVSRLFQNLLEQHGARALSGARLLLAVAGALWAAMNGTWAMVYGLNRAYEVQERRSRLQLTATIAGLTFALAVIGCLAMLVIFHGRSIPARPIPPQALQWTVLMAALSLAFAMLYRFAPNVRSHKWQWSTPGAACALFLWLAATFAAHIYFGQVNDYSQMYGQLNGVAMLLLWLYLTNGAILIGGEMNSEIEKAATASRKR